MKIKIQAALAAFTLLAGAASLVAEQGGKRGQNPTGRRNSSSGKEGRHGHS